MGIQITVDRIKLFSTQHHAIGIVSVTENAGEFGTKVTIEMPLVDKSKD